MPAKLTPMLRQYLQIKEEYPDCLIFYRMGDFYEMFFEDARIGAELLGVQLTSRNKQDDDPIPMCGVPHHALRGYLAKAIEGGFAVAICDQIGDPKKAKGLVERRVTRVVTAATITDPDFLEPKENLFLAAIEPRPSDRGLFGLAYMDLTTGQFYVREVGSLMDLAGEVGRLAPSELLLPEGFGDHPGFSEFAQAASLGPGRRTHHRFLEESHFNRRQAVKRILEFYRATDLASLGIDHLSAGISAAAAVLDHAEYTQRASLGHVSPLLAEASGRYLNLDETTQRHLELFHTLTGQKGKGTLIRVLDRTMTAMGGRLIRRWLANPLIDLEAIKTRQEAVGGLFEARRERLAIRDLLRSVADMERLTGRIVMGQAMPRELNALKTSIQVLGRLITILEAVGSPSLARLAAEMDPLIDIGQEIDRILLADPAATLTEGGIIGPGVDPELDEYNRIKNHGQGLIKEYQEAQRERTGISSLKVKFNKVFGYYIEVSKANLDKVPEEYHRKQTLVNHERYTTEELDEWARKIETAGSAGAELEYKLFTELRERVGREAERIKATAGLVARLDSLAGLAEVAQVNGFHRPQWNSEGRLALTRARHPVIEETVKGEEFVPNDILLDMVERQVLIITGPNMAGKSTLLRQVALAQIMAQMGGFVPADKADLSMVDRIFTRVGTGDELAKGHSTFMVEMNETARILHRATSRSLVVLDEIGRGTSTFDGLSLAWAVAEYLHDLRGKGVKTLMATHYHELIELGDRLERAKNASLAAKKFGDRIVFMRTLMAGGTSRSYGIEVAKLAGLPPKVLNRAKEILEGLEQNSLAVPGEPELKAEQPGLFGGPPAEDGLRKRLAKVIPDETTPLEALKILTELKELA